MNDGPCFHKFSTNDTSSNNSDIKGINQDNNYKTEIIGQEENNTKTNQLDLELIIASNTSIGLDYTFSHGFGSYIPINILANFESLQDITQGDYKLPIITIMKIMYGLIKAIESLHLNLRIHKNLCPKNIFFDQRMHPILSNIGLCNKSNRYLAPESMLRGKYLLISDVFSYGVIAREILDKNDVFGDKTIPKAVIEKFRNMIKKCLTVDMDERLTSSEVVGFFEIGNTLIDDDLEFSKYIIELSTTDKIFETIDVSHINEFVKQKKYFIAYHLAYVGFKMNKDPNFELILGILNLRGYGTIKNYHKAFNYFKSAAGQCLQNSLLYLGLCYQNGYGTEINYAEAFTNYKLASEQGNNSGKMSLAFLYLNGYGIEKDTRKAISIYKELASDYYSPAYFELGEYYISVKNFDDAFTCFNRGMLLHNNRCIFYLGRLYYYGQGVIQDNIISQKYWYIAGKRGCFEALYNLCSLYTKGVEVKRNLRKARKYLLYTFDCLHETYITEIINICGDQCSPLMQDLNYNLDILFDGIKRIILFSVKNKETEIKSTISLYSIFGNIENKMIDFQIGCIYFHNWSVDAKSGKEHEYLNRSLDESNPDSYYYMGKYYLNEKGGKIFSGKSLYYLNKAIELNCSKAYKALIRSYFKDKNSVKGLELMQRGIKQEIDRCYLELGNYYFNGINGFPKDISKAAYNYQLAFDKGNVKSLASLSYLYEKGLFFEKDLKKAHELIIMLYEIKPEVGYYYLGRAYKQGIGVEVDIEKAVYYYKKIKTKTNKRYPNEKKGSDANSGKVQKMNLKLDKKSAPYLLMKLGIMYERGKGTKVDKKKAFYYYKLAADKCNNANAMGSVAYFYEKGIGVDKDLQKAFEYYENAVENGNERAEKSYQNHAQLLKKTVSTKPKNP